MTNAAAANSSAPAAAKASPPSLPDFEATMRDFGNWIAGHTMQVVIGTLIGVGIVFVLMGIRSVGMRLCRNDPGRTHWRAIIGRVIATTQFWFMVIVAIQATATYAATPPTLLTIVRALFVIAMMLQAAIWLREFILGVVEHRAGTLEDHSGLQSALGIIRLLVTFALFAVATILILANLGVNVTGLVAGLGIGGIAIGLAAQGIFADLFAALSILFDRPFRRGDSVRWDTTSGTVEAIGLKTTRVRALTGEEIVISNTNLLNKELYNLARLDRRRIAIVLGVIYQTPVATLARIPDMMKAIVEAEENCSFFRCVLSAFNASSIDFDFQFDVHHENYAHVLSRKHNVMLAILQAFEKEGIEFAYPTQTSFTAAPDGKAIMPYPEVQMVSDVGDRDDDAPAPPQRSGPADGSAGSAN
ncbi:small-conductance mechanosensitive channel [Sphingomonas zeicaulis]|uniref:mechanosensitive ion channel family protein n=1 Tax=Sphingomonas zeicaulis TaxID=1632740 RepID=UPI003D19CF44